MWCSTPGNPFVAASVTFESIYLDCAHLVSPIDSYVTYLLPHPLYVAIYATASYNCTHEQVFVSWGMGVVSKQRKVRRTVGDYHVDRPRRPRKKLPRDYAAYNKAQEGEIKHFIALLFTPRLHTEPTRAGDR